MSWLGLNDPATQAQAPPASPDATDNVASAAQPSPAPTSAQPATPSTQPPKSMLSGILHAVGDVLGGTPTNRLDPTTNQIVPNQLTTGQRAGNVIGAAIRGVAAGAAQHGPGSVGRSAVVASQQEEGRQDARDQELKDKASTAIHAINTARLGWQFQRQKQILNDEAVDKFDSIDSLLGSDSRNQNLGTYPTFADFLKAHPELGAQGHDAPKLAANGLIVNTVPTDANGVAKGVKVWRIDPDWKAGKTTDAIQYRQSEGEGRYRAQTLSPGNKNSDVLALLQHDGYGAIAGKEAEGPKSHDEAIAHLANGSDEQQAQAQRYLDTEGKLSKGDALSKLENTPSMLARENAAAAIPQLNNMLTAETDPGKRIRITRLLSTAQSAHQGYLQDQKSEANAKQIATQGSPIDAGRLLADGSLTLSDLKTRGMTPAFILQATNNAQRINPSYKPSDEVVAENVAKSPAASQFFGSANSLISKGGTLDQLATVGQKIPQNKIPVLNTIEDWTKLSKGQGPLAGYAATILGVADDYGKTMGGGQASDSARNSALALIGAAQSPEQRASAIQSIRSSVGSQVKERIGSNQFLKRQYGYALPQETNSPSPQGGATPQGATHKVPGPDGKLHYTNAAGTVDLGVAQ
jgi:hypothetical protein